jgi:hypothetical protein
MLRCLTALLNCLTAGYRAGLGRQSQHTSETGKKADLLRRRSGLGDAEGMGRAWRLGADGNIRTAIGHRVRAARASQAEGLNALLKRGFLALLNEPARMQRAEDVFALPDEFRASPLTPQTNFPDHAGHCVPVGHATPSLVLAG